MCDHELFRPLCAYLKGEIVGYAARNGMKHASKRTPSEEFQAGYDKLPVWDGTGVTIRHIYYNWLRHGRSHTGSAESDAAFLAQQGYSVKEFLKDIRDRFGEAGIELLGEELS